LLCLRGVAVFDQRVELVAYEERLGPERGRDGLLLLAPALEGGAQLGDERLGPADHGIGPGA
jgi:hypothetical protein